MIEFTCIAKSCGRPIRFSLEKLKGKTTLRCPGCGRRHDFSPELLAKFKLLKELKAAIKKARPILGSAQVAIEVGGHQVKVPYNLLIGKMPTELALDFEGCGYQFLFSDDPENTKEQLKGEPR